jgi:hypothetical protein
VRDTPRRRLSRSTPRTASCSSLASVVGREFDVVPFTLVTDVGRGRPGAPHAATAPGLVEETATVGRFASATLVHDRVR